MQARTPATTVRAGLSLEQFLDQALRLLRGHAEIAKREWSLARVQHWLQSFQAFQVGPAPKQSNWNFFAPLITARDRLVQIARVVALFLENFDPLIEPLVSVVLVVSDARTENIHQREAFVLNGAFEHFDHVFLFAAESARHVSRPADDGHRDGINRVFNASVGRALGFHALDAGGRTLTGR